MNLAAALLGTLPIPETRGKRVYLMGEPPAEPVEPEPSAGELVDALCREIKSGITSSLIARLVGINEKAAAQQLARLRARGVIEVRGKMRSNGGRPWKVYGLTEIA